MGARLSSLLLLVAIATPSALAQTVADFEGVVDFETTLKGLDSLIRDGRTAEVPRKFLILDGTVRSISVLDPTPENYTVVVELVKGEWLELAEVRSYRSFVVFQGPQYAEVFPARRQREPSPQVIAANARVVCVAIALQPLAMNPGEVVWQLFGVNIRQI